MKNNTISSIIAFIIALTFLAGLVWTPAPAQAAAPELKAAGLRLPKSAPVTPRQDTGSGDPAAGELVEPAPDSPIPPATEGTLSVAAATAACTPPSMKIMPLGDSITRGFNTGGFSYRLPLYTDLNSIGFKFEFVGSLSDGIFTYPQHEGHSGFHAEIQDPEDPDYLDQIEPYVAGWVSEYSPAVVLLHIGTNDMEFGVADPDEIGHLLNNIQDGNPNSIVVVARIIKRRNGNDPDIHSYNNAVEAMVGDRIDQGGRLVMVDMENALDYSVDMDDDLHPNDSGYANMAAEWEKALYQILPICAGPDNLSAQEDGSKTISLTELKVNDVGAGLQITSVSDISKGGSATIINNGQAIFYTPAEDFNGIETFKYTVKAPDSGNPNIDRPSATATVNVTVAPVNDPPVPVEDSRSVAEDTPLTFPASDLKLNDAPGPADEAGQTLNVTAVASTANTHGAVSLSSGSITYTPEKDFAGAADFTYTVCDNDPDSRCAPGTVRVTVTQVNDAPVISAIPGQTTNEDTPIQVSFTVSDADTPVDSLSLNAAGSTNGGLVPLTGIVFGGSGANRTATLTPAANKYGATNITLTVTDGISAPVPAAFTLTVVSVNDPPEVTIPGTLTFPEGADILYQIQASDVESGANLTYEWDSGSQLPPGLGLDCLNKYSGKISGRLARGSAGAYTIRITVKDSPSDGGVTKVQFSLIVTSPSTQQVFIPLVVDRISR